MKPAEKLGLAAHSERKRGRGHATFFEAPVKSVKERLIVRTFLKSLTSKGDRSFVGKLKTCEQDPPDLIIETPESRRIAIEVTEWVDESSIRAVGRGRPKRWRRWTQEQGKSELQAILARKDSSILKGGPYHEYVVVIHTDEPLLNYSNVAEAIREVVFTNLVQIKRAFILFSYVPSPSPRKRSLHERYPVLELAIAPR